MIVVSYLIVACIALIFRLVRNRQGASFLVSSAFVGANRRHWCFLKELCPLLLQNEAYCGSHMKALAPERAPNSFSETSPTAYNLVCKIQSVFSVTLWGKFDKISLIYAHQKRKNWSRTRLKIGEKMEKN